MKPETHLVWMDLEMSGLDPERDRVLEIAVIVTDAALREVAEGPHLIVHQPEALLAGMDDWNQRHHGASGLTEAVRASSVTEADAEDAVLSFLRAHVPERACPLAGNSIHQDRRFLARYFRRLDAYLHYRMVDVSTIKELARRWAPEVFRSAPPKTQGHRALEDVRASIAELAYYRSVGFVGGGASPLRLGPS